IVGAGQQICTIPSAGKQPHQHNKLSHTVKTVSGCFFQLAQYITLNTSHYHCLNWVYRNDKVIQSLNRVS
ncbi:hypothetical protein, partial [Citrobacter freundii]|uniref:hypothetical protein n=1 Tax=Citrobacter freundii TaxID=546 RepID=UPI001F3F917C